MGCRLWGRTELDTTEVTWQQHTYFLILFSIMVYPRMLTIFPCALQWDLVVIQSVCDSLRLPTPDSQSVPLPPFGNHKSVLYVCESVSQIG